MSLKQEEKQADEPHETIQREVLDLVEEKDALPLKDFGVGGARFVYEKISDDEVDFDEIIENRILDPELGIDYEAEEGATFPAVGKTGALYALSNTLWKLRQWAVGGRSVGSQGSVPMRIYEPDGGQSDSVIVYFHAGQFVIGSIETHDAFCREIAKQSGATVVSVGYRLAPEDPYPTAIKDAYTAVELVSETFDYNDDLIVAGDSSGGTLAALTAIMARDRDGPSIDQQWLLYPTTEHGTDRESYDENDEGYVLETRDIEWFESLYLDGSDLDNDFPYTYPMAADDLSDLPPTTIITAGFDPLRDEGVAYADRLRDAGVDVDHNHHPDMIHEFAKMIDDPSLDRAHETIQRLADKV